MEFKAYHKIRQFKDVVRDIQFKSNYKGKDENGKPIYEESKKPTITFKGTVKLHGTNAGICYEPSKGLFAQKRSQLIGADALTAHFAFNKYVQVRQKDDIFTLMANLWQQHCNIGEQITLYGEWAGKGVQKGVGISKGKKSFFAFDLKVYNPDTDTSKWINIENLNFEKYEIENMYNIHNFPTYSIDIDFNNPGLVQNDLIEFTNKVEQMCPVSKQLGYEGIGEGIVWTAFWEDEKYIFKVKGKKHSTSKVKNLASVNPELIKSISEFIDYSCTVNRIEQGIQEINATEKKDMPALLRWVANDIITEESDTLQANSLEWKQVARECSNRVRQYFFKKIEKV